MYEIHISDVRNFLTCRQRWALASPLRTNLESKAPNRHLWLGSAIHYALGAYYGADRSAKSLLHSYEEWCTRQMAAIEGQVELTDELHNELIDARKLGKGMLSNYALWARVHDDFEVIMPEVQFSLPFAEYNGQEIVFAGTCDGLVKTPDGKYWILEHKTTAQFESDRKVGFKFLFHDMQCLAYVWATLRDPRFEGMRPEGVIYTFLRKDVPNPPKLLKSGELSRSKNQKTTYELYKWALRKYDAPESAYTEILETLRAQPDKFVARAQISVGDKRLETFEETLRAIVYDMFHGEVYPNPGMLGWNCKICPFFGPCNLIQNGVDPRGVLAADYRKRTRSPFDTPEFMSRDNVGVSDSK